MNVLEPIIPGDIPACELPDLLRNWHLGSKARRHLSRRRFRDVASLVADAPAGRALDAGCGWGYGLHLLRSRGFEPYGIDIVQNDFAAGRRIACANGFEPAFAGADIGALPFVASSFSAITAVETVEHIFAPDRMRAFEEARRVLVRGGVLALSTPNYHSIVETGKRFIVRFPVFKRLFPGMCYPVGEIERERYHPYRYHRPIAPAELRRMLEKAGFQVTVAKTIIFVWKNVPDAFFPLARMIERVLEGTPLVRRLASTLVVRALKV
jgi:ubiquinone/menaquinone biosynthesis C-methylase UbiE